MEELLASRSSCDTNYQRTVPIETIKNHKEYWEKRMREAISLRPVLNMDNLAGDLNYTMKEIVPIQLEIEAINRILNSHEVLQMAA